MIHLYIVDRAKSLSRAMARIFENEPDIHVVGAGVSAADALAHVNDCDVILVTAELPRNGALDLANEVYRQNPAVKVVVMDFDRSQEASWQRAAAGIAGYVMEEEPVEELLAKMRAIHKAKAGARGSTGALPTGPAVEL